MNRQVSRFVRSALIILIFSTCNQKNKELAESLDLTRGEITLCGSGVDQFGTVSFSQSCSEGTRSDFNTATALLHSFEYVEAEKIFAKVIDADPGCIMAYWGAAMCNFHPLWTPPSEGELEKGSKIVAAARSMVTDQSVRASDYLEAIATIYDDWRTLDYKSRLKKFENACQLVYEKYPDDKEAAVFYSLALAASADPLDKTFKNQIKAGEILNGMFAEEPNHPGIAHYLIHNYDYPELAERGLSAARKYASIAAASAHAQHMPSHIFTRLGLWDEAIISNMNSIAAAQCYAQNIGATGHWDEELHGLDYLTYAYLQNGNDAKAREQVEYLATIKEVFPQNFKVSYSFASIPARYALERKDWAAAASLVLAPSEVPWDKFLWEKANINFARLLGAVRMHNANKAAAELAELTRISEALIKEKDSYKANLVLIQAKAGEAWIRFEEGKNKQAIALMEESADMEDATTKHPVSPGEIIPARELLGDLYLEMRDYPHALIAYENDLQRHPKRYNGLLGAALAARGLGDKQKAKQYSDQLTALGGTRALPSVLGPL